MRVMISGSIIVPSSMAKKKSRPGHRRRAKEYATMAEESTVPMTVNAQSAKVLIAKRPNGKSRNASGKLRHCGTAGIHTMGCANTSVRTLSEDETIQSVGARKLISSRVMKICSTTSQKRSINFRRRRYADCVRAICTAVAMRSPVLSQSDGIL